MGEDEAGGAPANAIPGEQSGTPGAIVAPAVAVLALLLSVVLLAALVDERAGRPWDFAVAAHDEPPVAGAIAGQAHTPIPRGTSARLSPEWNVRVLGADQLPAGTGSAGARGVVVTIELTNHASAPASLRGPILGLNLLLTRGREHAIVPAHRVTSFREVVPGQGGVGNQALIRDELNSTTTVPAGGTIVGTLVYLTATPSLEGTELQVWDNVAPYPERRLALR